VPEFRLVESKLFLPALGQKIYQIYRSKADLSIGVWLEIACHEGGCILNSQATQIVPVLRYQNGTFQEEPDHVIREEPLEIWGHGGCLVRLVRLPGQDHNLVRGFCFSEGFIFRPGDISDMRTVTEGELTRIEVLFHTDLKLKSEGQRQEGDAGWNGQGQQDSKVRTGQAVPLDTLFQVRQILENGQDLFHATGGTHCAALFAPGPRLISLAEDVGRHNALDKVVGETLGNELEQSIILVLSSRLNSEMVGKAVRARIPILAGVSAPTQHGVHMADQAGMTLIGFLRPRRFNVYTHSWRVLRKGESQ
jgi:FdhD protein